MRLDILIEERFPSPVERVWHALTDPRMINRWLMATDDFEARVGARFTLRDKPHPTFRGYVECQVLELSPPNRMVWSWSSTDDPVPTRLVIELEAEDRGTRLTLRHTGDTDELTVQGTTAGWPRKLGELAETLSTAGSAAPDGDRDPEREQP